MIRNDQSRASVILINNNYKRVSEKFLFMRRTHGEKNPKMDIKIIFQYVSE